MTVIMHDQTPWQVLDFQKNQQKKFQNSRVLIRMIPFYPLGYLLREPVG